MKAIEEKIRNKQYSTQSIANAVVKRADISPQARKKLLELAETVYKEPPTTVPVNIRLNPETVRAPEVPVSVLDAQLLRIAFQLLVLCLEHKLSREEIYKRLDVQLKAGMG